MERKRYLELCQLFSFGNQVEVFFGESSYFPKEYILSFDEFGNVVHSAVLLDKNKNSVLRVNLERVVESEKENC